MPVLGPPADVVATRSIEDALRAKWRMIEQVALRPCPDGQGFEAVIRLNQTLVRAAAEQQGMPRYPDSRGEAEARRRRAIAECVQGVNQALPAGQEIRDFSVIGWTST